MAFRHHTLQSLGGKTKTTMNEREKGGQTYLLTFDDKSC